MNARKTPGYMTEELQPRIVGGPPRYATRTDKRVEHIALTKRNGECIGYIYANDEDDAAGWIAVAGLDAEGWALATPWIHLLHEAKRRGLKPTAALDQMLRNENAETRFAPGSRATSASLAMLRRIAGHPEEES
jgi:hypothetical protein